MTDFAVTSEAPQPTIRVSVAVVESHVPTRERIMGLLGDGVTPFSTVEELAARLTGAVPSAEPLLFRKVRVAGTWMADRQFYVDNRIREGRAGFYVVTPLAIEGSDAAVLVNRGWVARGPEYPRPPRVVVPTGRTEVSGMAMRPWPQQRSRM